MFRIFQLFFLSFLLSSIAFSDQGVTSPVHGNHIGEIVWSNNIISFSSPDESAFKNKFLVNEPIYGRIYQEKALNNYMVYNSAGSKSKMRDGGYKIHAYINDQSVKLAFGVFDNNNLSGKPANHWTTWQFSPHPKNREDGEPVIADKWIKMIRKLPAGEHEIRFELWPVLGQYTTKKAVAVGGFTLVVAAGEKVKSSAKLPKDSYHGANISSLKQKMKQALVGPVAKNSNEVLSISIPSNWKNGVYSQQIPRKEYRKITGVALWHDTNNDQLCRYTSYNFIQDKTNSGWSPLRFHSFCLACSEGDVECP